MPNPALYICIGIMAAALAIRGIHVRRRDSDREAASRAGLAWAKANGIPDIDAQTYFVLDMYRERAGESMAVSRFGRARLAVHLFAMSRTRTLPGSARLRSIVFREPEYLGIEVGKLIEHLFENDTFYVLTSIFQEMPKQGAYKDEWFLSQVTTLAELVNSGTPAANIVTAMKQAPPSIVVEALTHGIPLDYAATMNELVRA